MFIGALVYGTVCIGLTHGGEESQFGTPKGSNVALSRWMGHGDTLEE